MENRDATDDQGKNRRCNVVGFSRHFFVCVICNIFAWLLLFVT